MQPLRKLRHRYATSLRHRALLGLALVVLIAVAFVLSGVIAFVYRTEQDAWEARQNEATTSAAQKIENYLDRMFMFVMVTANLEYDTATDDASSLDRMLAQNDTLLELVRVDVDGQIIASANQAGTTVLLADESTITESDWFIQTSNGQHYTSTVQMTADGEPYIIVATPIFDGEVAAGRLNLTGLWDAVAEITFGDTGQAYIVDGNGNIIAHTDTEIVLNHTSIAGNDEMDAVLEQTAPRTMPDGNEDNPAGNAPPPEGERGVPLIWRETYTNFEGTDVIGQARTVGPQNWIIFTEMDRAEATKTTRSALLVLGGGMLLLGVGLFISSGYLLDRSILGPIDMLRQGAERIGAGDLDARITVHSADEIGTLATEFNGMAASLQQKITETEQLAEKANAANAFKSNLLARVSHELRNPLGGIMGLGEMLSVGVYGPLTDEQTEIVQRVVRSAQYLNQLVGELLEQSRIDNYHTALQITAFDPHDPLTEIAARNEAAAQAKGLALRTACDGDLPDTVITDRGKVEQIITNLISNAIKFTDEGVIMLRARRATADHWVIEVQDTGIGIPQDAQELIFEEFRQVDEQITRQHDGFGLGLSIVKYLTSLLDGTITVTSVPGEGSTFTVTLPITLTQNGASAPALEPVAAHA